MPMRYVPFGFSYNFDYVPVGRRKTVSAELEGSALAALEEIAPEDAPVVIRVTDNQLHGKDFPFCIRACGSDLLWPVLHQDDSDVTEDGFLHHLVDGTAFPEHDRAPCSLRLRKLSTIEELKIRKRGDMDFDHKVAHVQRCLAHLRICEGKIWIVGMEPVYVRDEEYVRLVKPPSPRGMLITAAPLSDDDSLFDFAPLRGDVFSLDELELALSGSSQRRKLQPFVEVRGWRARTDPIQLQLRETLRALLSAFRLSQITELPPEAESAIGRIDSLNRADAWPTTEDSAAALSTLADFCSRNPEVAEGIGYNFLPFIGKSIDEVVKSCTLRGRASPFPLSDEDDQALSSM